MSACSAETADAEQETSPVQTAEQTLEQTPVLRETDGQVTAPEDAWRDVDPENAILINTDHGDIIIELYPEIAPNHAERIKVLTRQKFYDFITFHRVIDGFMNQTGDPKGDGTGDSSLPDLKREFTFRRGPEMAVTMTGARPINPRDPNTKSIAVGFYKGLPVGTQPIGQSSFTKDGKVDAFALHCPGVTSMARTSEDTGNSQFFLMRGAAPWLDTQYSIWGNTVWGHENLTKIKVGTKGEDRGFVPDKMNSVRVLADIPEAERPNVQVLKTNSPAFKKHLKSLRDADMNYPDICDIEVPTRLKN